jgi:O-antigen ligase
MSSSARSTCDSAGGGTEGGARVRSAAALDARSSKARLRGVGWDEDAWTDLLFASASVVSISGLDVPLAPHVPIFVAFVALTTLASAKSLVQKRSVGAFVPPLFAFMCVHLTFAFRISVANGVAIVLQAVVVSLFVWAFVTRYSRMSMRRYLAFTGIGMVGMLAYVLGYHFSQGQFTSLKLLDDPKAVFNVLPVMLVVLHFNERRASKYLYAVLLPLFVAAILLSGERKAYILMGLVAPLLLKSRPIATYTALLVAIVLAVSLAMAFDHGGYISGQLGTLSSFAHGRVESTLSDDRREWAIAFARQLFEQHPIIGVGTNGYAAAVGHEFHEVSGAHNEWMRVAAENGIVGLFFYAATVLWGLVGLLRHRVGSRIRSAHEKIIALALLLTFVVYLSFEALDFVVMLSFCLIPVVQYLRLDPEDQSSAGRVLAGATA